jgi:hypothetical protein
MLYVYSWFLAPDLGCATQHVRESLKQHMKESTLYYSTPACLPACLPAGDAALRGPAGRGAAAAAAGGTPTPLNAPHVIGRGSAQQDEGSYTAKGQQTHQLRSSTRRSALPCPMPSHAAAAHVEAPWHPACGCTGGVAMAMSLVQLGLLWK